MDATEQTCWTGNEVNHLVRACPSEVLDVEAILLVQVHVLPLALLLRRCGTAPAGRCSDPGRVSTGAYDIVDAHTAGEQGVGAQAPGPHVLRA